MIRTHSERVGVRLSARIKRRLIEYIIKGYKYSIRSKILLKDYSVNKGSLLRRINEKLTVRVTGH